jgi:hypothetical protein
MRAVTCSRSGATFRRPLDRYLLSEGQSCLSMATSGSPLLGRPVGLGAASQASCGARSRCTPSGGRLLRLTLLGVCVQATEVQVWAQVRVTLKPLVSVFPCFSNITISLMTKVSPPWPGWGPAEHVILFDPTSTMARESAGGALRSLAVFAQVFVLTRFEIWASPGNPGTSSCLQPHIDFGLKLLGGDVMAIPGLYHFAQVSGGSDIVRRIVLQLFGLSCL